jgi:hypothetical protein
MRSWSAERLHATRKWLTNGDAARGSFYHSALAM